MFFLAKWLILKAEIPKLNKIWKCKMIEQYRTRIINSTYRQTMWSLISKEKVGLQMNWLLLKKQHKILTWTKISLTNKWIDMRHLLSKTFYIEKTKIIRIKRLIFNKEIDLILNSLSFKIFNNKRTNKLQLVLILRYYLSI